MTERNDAAAQFDQTLLQKVLGFLEPLKPITSTLDNVRMAADIGSDLPTDWPHNSVYVATDALVSIYSQIKKMMMAAQSGKDAEDPANSQEMMDMYIIEPSLMSVLVPWEKTRTIIKVNKKEFSDDLLQVNSKILATNPQWATFFDLQDQEISWDGVKIKAVGFARYFFGQNKAMADEECPVTVPGEPRSFINNIISVFLDENDNFLLGPYLPITAQHSILEVAEMSTNEILENIKAENPDDERLPQIQADALDTLERTKQLFKIFIYYLQNLENLRDPLGNITALPSNPATTQINGQKNIISASNITTLYLD